MKKITLVEDDHDLANMIQALLQSEGFDVSWADNGLDGVEACRALMHQTRQRFIRY